jgi:peptidyl-prolyl cis-trans isomerase A (cyclophilin A)
MNRAAATLMALLLAGCGAEAPKEAPKSARLEHAPEKYRAKFETTKGDFIVEVTRAWAPHGADRFFELVTSRYYDGVRFHRVLKKFIAQFGVNGDPKTNQLWRQLRIVDDKPVEKNRRGTIAFAHNGPATRTTQVFINLANNRMLDSSNFVPFGNVTQGMDVVDQISALYGELAPKGAGPDPTKAETLGNDYFQREFPRLDVIKRASIID